VAEVKKENKGSQKIFKKLEYDELHESDLIKYKKKISS
jgi:hypothetical protein